MECKWIEEKEFKAIEHEAWEKAKASQKKQNIGKTCGLKEAHRYWNNKKDPFQDMETEIIG